MSEASSKGFDESVVAVLALRIGSCLHRVGYTTFSGAFRRIAARAEVPFRCHDLRHHFESEFVQRTGDIAALQAILGHKAVAMTMRYSHLVTEHLHRAIGTNPGTNTTKIDSKATIDVQRGPVGEDRRRIPTP